MTSDRPQRYQSKSSALWLVVSASLVATLGAIIPEGLGPWWIKFVFLAAAFALLVIALVRFIRLQNRAHRNDPHRSDR